jgi:hypothetical protein
MCAFSGGDGLDKIEICRGINPHGMDNENP